METHVLDVRIHHMKTYRNNINTNKQKQKLETKLQLNVAQKLTFSSAQNIL